MTEMKFHSGPDLSLQVENKKLQESYAKISHLVGMREQIISLLEGCKDHTLFKLPPISTFVAKLKEIVK